MISRLLIFFKKKTFSKNTWEYHQGVNSLDPDQARHFVGPDLAPKCLQRLSADDKIYHQQTKSQKLACPLLVYSRVELT